MIYHIATKAEWDRQIINSTYAPDAYVKDGFVHCSRHDQVMGVLMKYFTDKKNLVLLHIDETKLDAELKYEPGSNQELFPHIYGPITKEAIVKIENLF
jgi:uncharacterized protein (DUF952 family)